MLTTLLTTVLAFHGAQVSNPKVIETVAISAATYETALKDAKRPEFGKQNPDVDSAKHVFEVAKQPDGSVKLTLNPAGKDLTGLIVRWSSVVPGPNGTTDQPVGGHFEVKACPTTAPPLSLTVKPADGSTALYLSMIYKGYKFGTTSSSW